MTNAPDPPAASAWPREQSGAVREVLAESDEPLPPEAVARAFEGRLSRKRRERVAEVPAILSDLCPVRAGEREGREERAGGERKGQGGRTLYFTVR